MPCQYITSGPPSRFPVNSSTLRGAMPAGANVARPFVKRGQGPVGLGITGPTNSAGALCTVLLAASWAGLGATASATTPSKEHQLASTVAAETRRGQIIAN